MGELRDVAAVRRLAEERAQAFHRAVYKRPTGGTRLDEWVEAQLDLLCDLARPESRDAVARLVAEAVGLECGATAPAFERVDDPAWMLVVWKDGSCPSHYFVDEVTLMGHYTNVPGIDDVTDPVEALRLIALHVLGESDV